MEVGEVFGKPIILQTERLIIRNLSMDDAPDLYEYCANPEVPKYLPWSYHKTINDTLEFLNGVVKQQENKQVTSWGIECKENSKLIGTCGFVWWQPENSKAEIGYALSPLYWNKGIMTEAVREVIKFGFEIMDLNRIEAHCVKGNIGSEKVMQKVGMKYEGLLRDYRKFKGIFYDFLMYSLLKKEYLHKNNE